MNLQALECFVEVAEQRKIIDAAQRLFITQPAVSRHIQNLEQELNVQLFYRTKPYLSLTPEGQLVYKQAKDIIERCRALSIQQPLLEPICIGFSGNLEYDSLFQIIDYMGVFLSSAKVKFERANMGTLYSRLSEKNYDIVFSPLTGFERNPDIETWPIISSQYVLAVSTHHPLADKKTVSISELANERFVTYTRKDSPIHSDMLIMDCEQAGFSPNIALEVDDNETYLLTIAANQAVALVGKNLDEITPGGIRFIPIKEYEDRCITSGAAWLKSNVTPLCAVFIKEIKNHFPKAEQEA